VRDRHAGVPDLVGIRRRPLHAVESLREDAREGGLPGAARAREEVGLAHLVGRDGVLQRPYDRLLTDDLVEVLGAVFPVEGGHEAILARPLDRPREGVANCGTTLIVALREPAPALLGRAVRPRLRIHLALRLLLDPVVADRRRRVEAAVD